MKQKNMKSKMKLNIKNIFLGLFLITTIMIAGCVTPVNPGNSDNIGNQISTQEGLLEDNNVQENTFKSIEEYQNFVSDYSSGSSGSMYYARGDAMMEKALASDSAAVPTAQDAGNGGSIDYSETNNQVIGVDEADMLKTDGEYMYTITENTVFIVKSYPGADAQVVSNIKFEDNYPISLFIKGNKLTVIGSVNQFDFLNKLGFSRDQGYVFMNIYDLTDKTKPELVKELKFEGQYNDARLIGSQVYLISTFYPQYREYPMPLMFEGTVKKEMSVQNIHYFNIPYSNPYLVIANSVNMDSLTITDSEAITVEGYPNIYMSEDNLYLTYTEYINEWEIEQDLMISMIVPKLSPEDQTFIDKVKNTDNDILSGYEKKAKILQIVNRYFSSLPEKERDALQNEIDLALKAKLAEYKYMEYTIINKLSVNSGQISVDANGKVPGHISNQFSLDEFEGNLRIATTISQRWNRFDETPIPVDIGGGIGSSEGVVSDVAVSSKIAIMPPSTTSESINNLYVLNSDLKVIGSIEGLAKGEQIFSVRFMEDRAYVVTFRQVDPFFAIDLSNPFSPEVLGILKIPGFSRYLHPYDDNVIIGIGRDATETGRQEGLKISLFDVSDITEPKEIAKYVSDEKYSSSTAEWEHKAFLFSKEKELLVIPVYNYDYENRENNMNGALVFKITEDSITLRGIIDHSGDYMYGPNVERSLYIEDMLYTKSPYLLRVNALDDLSSVKNVTLSTKDTSKIPVY
jgi:uncharacterized secreted protein with C-terminal beta-propeller domain